MGISIIAVTRDRRMWNGIYRGAGQSSESVSRRVLFPMYRSKTRAKRGKLLFTTLSSTRSGYKI